MNGPAAAPPRARWQAATIAEISHPTPRIASVMLDVPLRDHLAGQHLDVRLTAEGGYQAQRSYSICSAPGSPLVELAVERLDDGEVSPYFHDVAQPGDSIEVRGPIGGHFVWRAQDGGPLLMLAGGSGIAPLVAMARERAVNAPAVPALLVYSARTWEDMIYREELIAIEARQPDFRFVAVTTRGTPARPQDYGRRLDGAVMKEILAKWKHTPAQVYACGSNNFVEATVSLLLDSGIPAGRIRTERYGGTNGKETIQ